MDLLTLIAGFTALALTVLAYWRIVEALNRRAATTYGYRPINLSTGLIATTAYVLAILGLMMGGDNAQVGLMAGLLLFGFLFLRVAIKTSLAVGLLALPLLVLGGLGLLIVIVILYLILAPNKGGNVKQGDQ